MKGDAQALAEFEVVRYKAIVKEKFQARIPKNRISTTTRDTSNRYTETQLAKHPYGHNLQNVFIECLKQSADFASVSNDVSLLRGIPMNVRYSMEKVSLPNIVETIWASLRVGGLCACRIANNQRRYHNPYWIKQWKK